LGAYGNTREATQQPPLDQMSVTLETDTPALSGQPGETVTYTLILKNNGSVMDTYAVTVRGSHLRFQTSLFETGSNGARQFTLAPQEQIAVMVWDEILVNPGQGMSNTFAIWAVGSYGVRDVITLTTSTPSPWRAPRPGPAP
jgi:uncharacterized membrane protein